MPVQNVQELAISRAAGRVIIAGVRPKLLYINILHSYSSLYWIGPSRANSNALLKY
jgi:hypothetical protein